MIKIKNIDIKCVISALLLIISNIQLLSQNYFYIHSGVVMDELEINTCTSNYLGPSSGTGNCSGLTMTPDSLLLSLSESNELFIIDQATGIWSQYYTIPPPPFPSAGYRGIVSVGNGIFYSVTLSTDRLYEINIITGTITDLGNFPFYFGEFALFDGEIYFTWWQGVPLRLMGIRKVNLLDPANSELVVDLQNTDYDFVGLSGSILCNTLISPDRFGYEFFYINLIDGVITQVCESVYEELVYITSMLEFEEPLCEIYLDLDEDDSSGAIEADYEGNIFDCLSNGVPVSDNDITILYDALLDEMTIEIVGVMPDAPNEFLYMAGTVPGINVTGEGTTMITLSNAGNAKSTDFKEALRRIRYDNSSILPTGGLRTIEVQFTTESGSMSNIATAFIQVNELPFVEVDLGPNQEACEGETVTFDAGNPGATYEWSTGESSQVVSVSEEGEYIVTVNDGINCPYQDTAELILLPVIHVSLEGDQQICDNEQANLIISTDATFPLTVEISTNPGSPFIFNNVIGTFSFNDLPSQDTEYTITSVTSSQPACIEITDPGQIVDVYPSYVHSFEANICNGDSIWLGFYWETEPGVYENTFETFDGCDSVVTSTVTVLPAIQISMAGTTCDSAQAGVFVDHLSNPDGCDTVITTTITLLPSDTTDLSQVSCRLVDAGVFTEVLSNQQGCDSLVITTISWTPPTDTTFLVQTSCDSAALGIFQQILAAVDGCDSIVVTSVSYASIDTTYSFATSCDSTQIGVTQQLYTDPSGCDSLVIMTITAGLPDTTYEFATSCDSASLGVYEEHFTSVTGCDSVVSITVTYSARDSTFLEGTSCDEGEAGVFVQALVNRFGCDSIVTTTIELLLSDEQFIFSETCDPASAGVFVENLINQSGCDSVVTTTVELLPLDETVLSSTTCMSAQAGTFITAHQNQYGCDSIVTLTVLLVPADTTTITNKTCDPAEVGMTQNTFTGQDGCDSLVIEQTTLYPLPELQLTVTSDYNGYAISCFGESDGSASAEVNGVPPWTYLWSTGNTDQTITGLSAGSYAVTVIDGNGCIDSDEVILFEPEEFSINFIVSQPDCFDHQEGTIAVEQTGGVEPVRYSIDGVNYQSSPIFDQLTGGTYTVTAFDANDCEVKEIIWINVPLMVDVELGDDMLLFLGDTAVLHAIVNVPMDSIAGIEWSGLSNPDCSQCLTQAVAPVVTTTYSVEVTTHDGCSDEDALTLFLERNDDVYVPNVFSPNGDNINDEIMIYTGSDVEKILEWVIFDRWGNVVFSANNFLPNDLSDSWDGTMKGKTLNPGVFAYRMIVEFHSGGQHVIYGDITLIR